VRDSVMLVPVNVLSVVVEVSVVVLVVHDEHNTGHSPIITELSFPTVSLQLVAV
jgi:hypothetical protein